jgi:hypothetical protein
MDDREPLGRIAWETFVAWSCEQPGMTVRNHQWNDLGGEEKELYERIGSAVAVQAVHDAGVDADRMRAQLFALGVHAPAIRRALTIAITASSYEAEAKDYRAALKALGGGEDERG